MKEVWFFQDGSQGPQVIVYSENRRSTEKAAKQYQESQEEFVVWFKKEVDRLSGIDPNKDPLGSPYGTKSSNGKVRRAILK